MAIRPMLIPVLKQIPIEITIAMRQSTKTAESFISCIPHIFPYFLVFSKSSSQFAGSSIFLLVGQPMKPFWAPMMT